MPTYKTPDVYVEEISIFPPSVAEVETAVPAFIGYTERDTYKGKSYRNKPRRVTSLAEYKEIFGGGPSLKIKEVKLKDDNTVEDVEFEDQYYMYDSLELFYANGGGKCYIVSVGIFPATISITDLEKGLKQLELEDEPTLILFPDAPLMDKGKGTGTDLYALQQAALKQAAELMDRFVIMDLLLNPSDDDKTKFQEFRDNVGINNLKYGAAYMPYLKTALPKTVRYNDLLDSSGNSVLKKPAVVDLTALTESTEVRARIQSYKNLLSFKRAIATLTTPDSKQLNDVNAAYKAISKEFYDAESAQKKAKFNDLLTYIYGLLKAVNNAEALTNSYVTQLKGNSDTLAIGTAIENGSFEKYITVTTTDAAEMQAALLNLNKYIISARTANPVLTTVQQFLVNPGNIKATKSDDTDVGSSTNPYVFSASWGDAFKKVDALNAASVTAVYGASGNTVTANLETAEPKFQEEFKLIRNFINDLLTAAGSMALTLEDSITMEVPAYKDIRETIAQEVATIPPSGTIAGVYSYVDRTRGVWKAPANVSLNSVIDVTEKIDNKAQEELNVDVVAGKSINAIRPFAGKGVLVWGARTLAGNDNEWRYISVRRFFNMVEESCKKSTYWAVFEPNDANLWIKVKAMIENYLIEKWRDGALAGAKPEHAFFVNVGLGKTMTAQDILEGRLIIEIGMAVVRPAEFIILRFMHKMQES